MKVSSGSYVLPADVVGGIGQGNTIAGFKVLRRMFGGTPYGGGATPYGAHDGPYNEKLPGKAAGGEIDDDGDSVPIIAAGGEMVLSPQQVIQAGGGDMDLGHRVLDEFVKRMRADTIKTMQNLPGPRRD